MASNIGENSARFFLSTSGPRIRGCKQNETDNPERLRTLWANSKYKNKAQLVLGTKGPTALKGRQLEVMIWELGLGVEVRVSLGSWPESFVKGSLVEEQRNVTE